MLEQDLEIKNVPKWGYFCQISDSTTSYGSYSGAVPNEKITWGKLDSDTPRFVIESDATIVAPLIFATILESTQERTLDAKRDAVHDTASEDVGTKTHGAGQWKY
jgi:deoxyhypusine synthase